VNSTKLFLGGTFRLSVVFSGACVVSGVLLFATIYWQTKEFETRRIGAAVLTEASTVSHGSADEILWTVRRRTAHEYQDEYHDMSFAALFTPDGRPIAGNLEQVPAGLVADGRAHEVELSQSGEYPIHRSIIAVASPLPDGTLLVFGRGIRVLRMLAGIVARALLLGAIPAIGPGIAAGIWLSQQARRRVKAVNRSIERIMQGNVHERLPVHDMADDFDHLASSVNCMLAEIEDLLAEVQGVSDNIAHDLRTPLARVRTLLERGRDKARTKDELVAVADRAIAGLDQAQSIITALLRIGELEGGQRRSAFGGVDLGEVVRETADLYSPLAEEKQIRLDIRVDTSASVHGDRDLLIEVIANLLDNAIKFTPSGGDVLLLVVDRAEGPIIRISDTGPGIPPEERTAVMKRFYRIDKSRHINGSGLGLSIVLAIVKLHDFDIAVGDAQPGCWFELRCYVRTRSETKPASWLQKRPSKVSASDPGGETNGNDRINKRIAIDAAAAASD
jgi:signal transduction histidine kinase